MNQANTQGQTIIGLNSEVKRLKDRIRDMECEAERGPEANAAIIDIRPTIGNSVCTFFFGVKIGFIGQVV